MIAGRDTKLTCTQRFHYLTGWRPWLSDAAGLLFTFGALAWTAMQILSPATTELPTAAFLVPTLAAFVFRQRRLFKLYGQDAQAAAADGAKAALAGLALSHTVAKAVIWGLFTSGRPFFRTPKCRRGLALFRSLAMASEKGSMLCAMMAASAGFIVTNDLWHLNAWLWLTVLAVMSLPYAATVLLGAINGIPRRARTRTFLGGATPRFPPFHQANAATSASRDLYGMMLLNFPAKTTRQGD